MEPLKIHRQKGDRDMVCFPVDVRRIIKISLIKGVTVVAKSFYWHEFGGRT